VFKKGVLLFASVGLAAMLVCGAALAKDITCRGKTSCFGTDRADTMVGTRADNNMFGLAGKDAMKGRGGADYVRGEQGADEVRGGPGADLTVWGGGFDNGGNFNDRSDDQVYGGGNADTILGGFARSGVDHLYGGDGDDTINAAQRNSGMDVVVTKEVIDCGPGQDTVYFDEGKDEAKNCEIKNQGTASSGRMATESINDDGVSGNEVPLPSGEATP
jgi:Ca2+-binding RTX toxin-like protein